ncbi:MAG: tRNA 5-methoxyuridine(34)/uridine 5-oxyacetic acid(34) synthase CmoB [Cellvibrionaceae bacterium]|nr:tRNA 5-methoxyuridine(34)/uridine 5-oxyacetic acid(34) synthase CmoB [Cellvibrionaceae bacterium]
MLNYYQSLLRYLDTAKLESWAQDLHDAIAAGLSEQRYGDLRQWRQALESLPVINADTVDLHTCIALEQNRDKDPEYSQKVKQLDTLLRKLIPWRKGPFSLFGIEIDSEWRSDWKWNRLSPHMQNLRGRTLLDVGCSNGYHSLRCYGAGAERVIGIDPSPRFVIQFLMLKHFLGDIPVDVLPIGLEALPKSLQHFDTTLSMGVFYHRRSPMDHLRALKNTLVPGGELILETLVIEGSNKTNSTGECLVPAGRYAKMNNVWFIPTVDTLIHWLKKCGFSRCRLVDQTATSTEEQRSTAWMQWQSLNDFLDPNDPSKTIEGHPAPIRAIIIADT